jgi:hypothetical protein
VLVNAHLGHYDPPGIGRVHRIPPVELKCLSEKRRGAIAALAGETKAVARG